MQLKLLDISKDLKEIREIWTQLSSESNHSYFLSWGWMENWIKSLPNHNQIMFIVIYENKAPCIAFFLGKNKITRNHIIKSRGLFLNTSGSPLFDSPLIEYNSMIYKRERDFSLEEILNVLPEEWDEFFMPGLDSDSFPGNRLDQPINHYHIVKDAEGNSPYVDLDLVREKSGDYLSLLSANSRGQIKKSYRKLKSIGKLTTEIAKDSNSCMDIYNEMVKLHNKSWEVRRRIGAFVSDYFYNLHQELIRKRFNYGEIQLIRVKCDEFVLGCLYNFVYQGKVFFYQSGINYEIPKEIKPGIICHVEAIKLNTDLGNFIYDFLVGSEQYKLSLSTNTRKLIWARVQKPLSRFWVENKAKMIKHAIEQHEPSVKAADKL